MKVISREKEVSVSKIHRDKCPCLLYDMTPLNQEEKEEIFKDCFGVEDTSGSLETLEVSIRIMIE